MKNLRELISSDIPLLLSHVPEGYDAMLLAQLLEECGQNLHLHIARDGTRLANMAELVGYFAPEVEVLRSSLQMHLRRGLVATCDMKQ